MKIDDIDQTILDCLAKDGRSSHAEIGRQVGITGPAVYARLRRMEEAGVIRGYRADVDRSMIGQPLVAFVRITTRPIKMQSDTLEPFIWSEPRIVECHDITGEDTFIVKAQCKDPEDLRKLLLDIRAQPQVIKTISSVALVVVKEPGMKSGNST